MRRTLGVEKRFCDRGWCMKETEHHVFWYKLKADENETIQFVCQHCGHLTELPVTEWRGGNVTGSDESHDSDSGSRASADNA